MAQAQHTPGPWFARKNTAGYYDISIGDADYSPSFAAAHQNPYMQVDADVLDANARLIAAAPDLLAMLKVAQLWLDVDGRFDMQGINAAIARAEGCDQ